MKLRTLFLSTAIATSLPASAGGDGAFGFVRKLGTLIDSMTVRGVDRRYLGAPEKPWQLLLKSNVNQSDLKLSSSVHNAEDIFGFMVGDMTWEPRVMTNPASYLGFWGGYRGYGLGFSWNVGGDNGRILTVGATGGSYGVNMRIHWFEKADPEVYFAGNALVDFNTEGDPVYTPFTFSDVIDLPSPIKTRALFLDGYYLFNGKKCSYAAAYDQSVIQKRSAGSLMAGAMYFHSTIRYDTDDNADLILFMNDIGRMKSWQGSVGAGYIYNWVPTKGLLVSGMAIPMITLFNHQKMWRYDSNLKDLVTTEGLDAILDYTEFKEKIRPSEEIPVESRNSNTRWNLDARLSITYEWDNLLFINAYGQFCTFPYKMDDVSGRLNDWYINASIGIRL